MPVSPPRVSCRTNAPVLSPVTFAEIRSTGGMGVAMEGIWQEGEGEEEGGEGVGRSVVVRFCRRRWAAVGACWGRRGERWWGRGEMVQMFCVW